MILSSFDGSDIHVILVFKCEDTDVPMEHPSVGQVTHNFARFPTGIGPGMHLWKASALAIAPSGLPNCFRTVEEMLRYIEDCETG